MPMPTRSVAAAVILLRLALAAVYLSAVADRFGLWGPAGTPGVAWGNLDLFHAYTGKLLWYLPPGLVPIAGWTATILEISLAVGLLIGVRLREVCFLSGLLLATFALSMTVALGPEPPLSYSVWVDMAASFLLAAICSPAASEVEAGNPKRTTPDDQAS